MSKYNDTDLEKIRYQLGKVIKSWSKVERIIEENYVAYSVKDTVFCYLLDDLLVLPCDNNDLRKTILSRVIEIEKELALDLPSTKDPLQFSLQQYEFTDLLPVIELVYRDTMLSTH